ncbi:MAG: tetratricopeptide repeat protein [Candidatus Solibacter sp.]
MLRRAKFALVCGLICVPCPGAADDAVAALQRRDFVAAEQKLRAELKLHPKDAERLSMLGLALDGQNKLDEAGKVHDEAVALAPNSAGVLGNYGNHLALKGDDPAARAAFEKVLRLDPQDRYSNLQMAHLLLRTRDAEHARGALEFLERLPAAEQEGPEAAVLRLTALDRSGDAAGGQALAEKLLTAVSKDAEQSASIGWTLALDGQYERAETFLTRALALDPANFKMLYNSGVASLYAGHFERARDVLEKAARQKPDSVDALYSLAFTYNALKQPEPTLRTAAAAARLAPNRADVQRLIAVSAGELKANEDSAAAWDKYVLLAPDDDTGRRERGFARVHLRDVDAGIADLEWYLARHPNDPVAHYQMGLALSTNDPTKGMASLDKALELKPDFVAARAARGALYYLQGKPEAAVPDLEAASAAEPSNGLILDRLGQAYRAMDRLNDAVTALRKAAELSPGEPTIQLHLGSALSEAGKEREAEVLIEKYRNTRTSQAPRELMTYLSLTPEQQRADYRKRVEKAVQDAPEDATAQLHYLRLLLEENQMAQAAKTARAMAGLSASAGTLADAGRALLEAQQFGPAKELLAKAAASDATGGVQFELAIAAFRTAGAEEGLRSLDAVPETRRDAGFYFARAQMLDAAGQGGEAIAASAQAIQLSPRRAEFYWQLSVLLSRNGRTDGALSLLDRAEKLFANDPQILLVKATLLEADGKSAEADKVLDGAQKRWPEAAPVWVARGILAHAHQRFDEARKSLETASALGARSPEAYYYLADSTLRSAPKRRKDAEDAIRKAQQMAPDDEAIKALAARIAKGTGEVKSPDPGKLFRTRPPQEW